MIWQPKFARTDEKSLPLISEVSLTLARNPAYWGAKARWDYVTFRFIPDAASRVAALLSGEVDAIDDVPPGDHACIKGDPRFAVYTGNSDRTLFLSLDLARATSPTVTGADGKPIMPNPPQDVRVRRALAVDRPALRDRVLNGAAFPANQLLAEGFGGYAGALPPAVADVRPWWHSRRARSRVSWARIAALQPEAGAISLLYSSMDPVHEGRLESAIRQALPDVPVYLSSQVNPQIQEYPRTNTTAVAISRVNGSRNGSGAAIASHSVPAWLPRPVRSWW